MIRSHTSHGIPCPASVSIQLPAISRSASGDRAVRIIATASATHPVRAFCAVRARPMRVR
eukprot:5722261-Prymnesium_polylepis.1